MWPDLHKATWNNIALLPLVEGYVASGNLGYDLRPLPLVTHSLRRHGPVYFTNASKNSHPRLHLPVLLTSYLSHSPQTQQKGTNHDRPTAEHADGGKRARSSEHGASYGTSNL